MNQGPFDRNTNILNIQPVIPLLGGKVITRTVMPIVNIPDYGNETGKLTSGLADMVFTAFYVPESKGLTWGFGPVLNCQQEEVTVVLKNGVPGRQFW